MEHGLQLVTSAADTPQFDAGTYLSWRETILLRPDKLVLTLALWSVPVSIAVAEFFLALAILARIVRVARHHDRILIPRSFWYWLVWAGMELIVWATSSQPSLGRDEIRHLGLLAALFFVVPAFDQPEDFQRAWRGIFLTSTLSSIFLIGDFIARFAHYHREILAGGDVGLYLRSGGLLNHWMIYATIEILVVAAFCSYLWTYPEKFKTWWPAVAVGGIAIGLSLTRLLWATCLLLLGVVLAWRRSRWLLVLPLLPLGLYVIAPAGVRLRLSQSIDPAYYSNAERIEMLRVSWKMVHDHPLTGVGPGRVDRLYKSYLNPKDPVPAWHGHFHNNLAQIAAQFGIPVTLAALVFIFVLFYDLIKAHRAATAPEDLFLTRTAILALIGFGFAGLFEYTYGHSLGLILLGFAVLPALLLDGSGALRNKSESW